MTQSGIREQLASEASVLHEEVENLQSELTEDNAEDAKNSAMRVQNILLAFKNTHYSDVELETQVVADVVRAEELIRRLEPQTESVEGYADQILFTRHQMHALITGDMDRWRQITTDMSQEEFLESEREEVMHEV